MRGGPGGRRPHLQHARPLSLRRVHYLLVVMPGINQPNTVNAYDKLSEWVRDMRLGVLGPRVPWEMVRDSLRGLRGIRAWDDPDDWADEVKDQYRRDVWDDQPAYIEVWCEKDALSSNVSRACRPYRAYYNIGRGYDGWTSIKQAAYRYRRRAKAGAPVTVLYFGDFDPSGEDMHRSLIERLAVLGAYPDLPKVSLTVDEARALPPDFTKAGDSRAAAFIARYGDLAVELDAMDEDELEAKIGDAIAARMDLDALAATLEQERQERDHIRETMESMFP